MKLSGCLVVSKKTVQSQCDTKIHADESKLSSYAVMHETYFYRQKFLQ